MSKETKKRARRTHTREFKADTVKLVRSGSRNASPAGNEDILQFLFASATS